MKSLSLAILMGVILSLAVFAQASSKDIVVPSGHPAADLKAYDKYEDVLDRIAAYQAADLKAYDKYEDVLDRIEAYLAELQKIRSGIALKDNR
jgi:hypothetical protein